MIAISVKPVRYCAGCVLNLGKRCGIFDHPVLKWKNRKCEGYNNPAYIQHYERLLKPEGARARKVVRRTKAKVRKTADHRDGRHRLAGVR
jgi:hypothetical protein